MKTLTNLTLLSLAVLTSGCNEKISPELLKSNTTVPTNTEAPVPQASYSFSIKNSSPLVLNYKLHKTGYGNAKTDCQIKSENKFDIELFQDDQDESEKDKVYDISCFFEAEELALYFNGFSFSIESSPNSCDYIGYQPFGFFDKIPGNSTGVYSKIVCPGEIPTSAELDSQILNLGGTSSTFKNKSGTYIPCGMYVSKTRDGDSFISIKDETELCKFNYKDAACDIGEITINELIINVGKDSQGARTVTGKLSTNSENPLQCGGRISNCVKGPVKSLNVSTDSTNTIEVSAVATNTTHTKNYSYPSVFTTNNSVKVYANYRRHLANENINFGNSKDIKDTFNYDVFAFAPLTGIDSDQHTFQPHVMELYARNMTLDQENLIFTFADAEKYGLKNYPGFYAVPYAAEPFLGLTNLNEENDSYNINPFYTFYCFDKAYDVKARIRMVVREWDRIFSDDDSLELLSDIWKTTKLNPGRQDSFDDYEVLNQSTGLFNYNDVKDWDDQINMTREIQPGFSTPEWKPSGVIDAQGLHDGWFNQKKYFTDGKY